jgi:probable F420-dependent oxidoreductase
VVHPVCPALWRGAVIVRAEPGAALRHDVGNSAYATRPPVEFVRLSQSGGVIELGKVGIWSGELRRHPDTALVASCSAELEELGYSALFIPGGAGGDVLERCSLLLEATKTVAVAPGILNVWMHDPADVAVARARIDAEHPGRFLLGLGISHAPLVDSREPGRYRKPLTKMRSYLDELDAADPPVPREARFLAALGPKMLDLSRERSAGAHPYFVPVEHTAFARERLGPEPLLAPEQAVLVETDPERARSLAREHVTRYLELPNYTNNLLRHGFTQDDLADRGSDRLVDAIVAWGDEQAVAARVRAHLDAGADHVCIQALGSQHGEPPREQWRRLAPALVEA